MSTKIFTVVTINEDDGVFPFSFSYASKEAAIQGIEECALEVHKMLLDPNDAFIPFPGLDWDEGKNKATDARDCEYWITETELR